MMDSVRPKTRAVPALLLGAAALLLSGPAYAQNGAVARIDGAALARDVGVLAADSMEGRRVGTPGSERARRYLVRRFQQIGLQSFDTFEKPFTMTGRQGAAQTGVNIVGWLRGSAQPERYIVITAHYDHLGIRNGDTFNGADDNASGSAGILALAGWFKAHPSRHSLIFVAFDAEESGLRGARAFLASPPVPRENIVMNVNLDMIGRNDKDELYAAGTYHYPQFVPLIEAIAAEASLKLRTGHDRPGLGPGDDWTNSSDHGPFHAAGIPFLYFGVEDHADYHKATDDFERIQPDFHARAVETVLSVLLRLDREAASLLRRSAGATIPQD
jgi:hypothetical protein